MTETYSTTWFNSKELGKKLKKEFPTSVRAGMSVFTGLTIYGATISFYEKKWNTEFVNRVLAILSGTNYEIKLIQTGDVTIVKGKSVDVVSIQIGTRRAK